MAPQNSSGNSSFKSETDTRSRIQPLKVHFLEEKPPFADCLLQRSVTSLPSGVIHRVSLADKSRVSAIIVATSSPRIVLRLTSAGSSLGMDILLQYNGRFTDNEVQLVGFSSIGSVGAGGGFSNKGFGWDGTCRGGFGWYNELAGDETSTTVV